MAAWADDRMMRNQARRQARQKIMLITILTVIGFAIVISYIVFSDASNVVDDFISQRNNATDQYVPSKYNFAKEYEITKQAQGELNTETAEQSSSTGSSGGYTGSASLLGGHPIEWSVYMQVYESNSSAISWNTSDGGFGPVHETHSGLGNTVDMMYLANPDRYSFLKPFVDNPLSYLRSCPGNHTAAHKWGTCYSHPSGSEILSNAFAEYLGDDTEKWHTFWDDYLKADAARYYTTAVQRASTNLGLPESELPNGFMAVLISYYIRRDIYNDNGIGLWNGIMPGMDADAATEQLNNNIRAAESGEAFRWTCNRTIWKELNAGTLDPFAPIHCDRSCGSGHGGYEDSAFGKMFGIEGY